MASERITPIRKQYLDIKRQYPNTILFFRLGDFYETFDHDAEITSQILGIVLTSRNVAKGQRIPMAGIPYHAAENYIGKLIEKGYHIAICEQVGEQPKMGLFPRQVTRIITPGTITEPGLLKTEKNNYLMAIIQQNNRAGISFADISTGEFSACEIEGDNINSLVIAEISRINPSEILLMESQKNLIKGQFHITTMPDWRFENNRSTEEIKNHFQVATLDGFGFQGKTLAIGVAGVIIQYLKDTDPNVLKLLTSISNYSSEDYMILDAATRRNLELTESIRGNGEQGSLLSVIDNTISPMGRRLIRNWLNKPLIDTEKIKQRLGCVEFLIINDLVRSELKSLLHHISDIERLISKIISQHALPRDLVALRSSLGILPDIYQLIEPNRTKLSQIISRFNTCQEELELLNKAISEDPPATLQNVGIIKSGFCRELDEIVAKVKDARDWISNLENVERSRTGIKTLKVGYNKIFGYYIEISNANSGAIPKEYIRKQTLVNAERYITPEMKEYEALVLNAEEQIHSLEIRLFVDICLNLEKTANKIFSTANCLAELDVFCSLAESAVQNNYHRPEILEDTTLEIKEGRHPVVERSSFTQLFIPNDAFFDDQEIIRVITGPNMSGKSTYLRQVALIVLLAQIGSFVPADQARIGVVDRIFTRIGAQDEIFSGQSTFMVEMVETANILNNATHRSLLILDEIGRGTSTYDGLAIAWAVIEYIHNHSNLRARTFFATHYHELIQLSQTLPNVRNFNVAVSEVDKQVIFLHKIEPGGADKSYGIHVAQMAGVPCSVTQRAHELLQTFENNSPGSKIIKPPKNKQLDLFLNANPILLDLKQLDLNLLTPLEALNKLHEWQERNSNQDPNK